MTGAATPNGILLVDKPAGISSHAVVARVRRALGVRRVGHAGTLDPAATGLLVLGVGAGTRLLTFLVGLDKRYEATIRLGIATTTDDAAGETVSRAGCPADIDVGTALAGFRGPQRQRPSDVSAVKVAGVRAYQRARAGEAVQLPERDVIVHDLQIDSIRSRHCDGLPVVDVDVTVHVSSGTYIRAIARDLGDALGVGGHVTALRRTCVGPFRVSAAVPVDPADDVAAALGAALMPLGEVAAAVLPSVLVPAADVAAVRHGTRLPCDQGIAGRAGVPPEAAAPDDPVGAPGGGGPRGPEAAVALLDSGGQLLAVAVCANGRWEYRFVVHP